jgi:hypothetical protein
MVYTLIKRDCQANPALMQAGLRTTDQVLETLSSFCLTAFFTSSGKEFFWLDTSTEAQKLIWRELGLPDPETRVPSGRPACLTVCEEKRSRLKRAFRLNSATDRAAVLLDRVSQVHQRVPPAGKALIDLLAELRQLGNDLLSVHTPTVPQIRRWRKSYSGYGFVQSPKNIFAHFSSRPIGAKIRHR